MIATESSQKDPSLDSVSILDTDEELDDDDHHGDLSFLD